MERMAQKKYLAAKLKNCLREDKIQLWKPPYTNENKEAGLELKELAQKYSAKVKLSENETECILEEIRCEAIERGTGNEAYKTTGVAKLELVLPPKMRKTRKSLLETKLIITGEELRSQIAQMYGFQEKCIKIIINKKQLDLGKTLEEQGVTHNVKVMVLELRQSEEDTKKKVQEEEMQHEVETMKEKERKERMKRTKKGLEILATREDYLDPDTTPYLDIANQTGRSIKIPQQAKRSLLLAMGYHEKGRAFMKKKEYAVALPFLLDADKRFCDCGNELLNTVDNYAALQLDIVWCYFRLGQLECLDDAEKKLATAHKCFKRCYGENHERLLKIKGSSGSEEVLFLRLYLLQGIGNYHNGKGKEAFELLQKEKAQIRREERAKKRRRLDDINTLKTMGYSERAAKKALHRAQGNLEQAFKILLDEPQLLLLNDDDNADPMAPHQFQVPKESIDQLMYMGFNRESVEEALKVFQGNIQLAAQTLAHYGGVLPAELQLSPEQSTPSEESISSKDSPTESAGTSSSSTDEDMETDVVNEILEDIPEHEEDYLDLTLEEEEQVIKEYLSYMHEEQP
ncbi:NEDD8 ultimate buster 1 isoform 2-T2 [Pangshura tecta]